MADGLNEADRMISPHGGRLIDRTLNEDAKERALSEAKDLLHIEVDEMTAWDVENIATGVFSPLEGFLTREDLDSVMHFKRLANDLPWTIPIILDVDKEASDKISVGDTVGLDLNGRLFATLTVDEKYMISRKGFAQTVFGTTDPSHPGVTQTYKMKDIILSGKINLVQPIGSPYQRYCLTPSETRALFKEKGWKTVVGFQTRNVPHIGHEYVQKTALTFVDGIFINPVIGRKKAGDFKDEVILESYSALIDHYYLKERAVLSILQTEMRYAGPREAIFHAVVRKNFGCTHFVIGRDHAGVGKFYHPYAAQDVFEEFPDIGIVPLFFTTFFYCTKCGSVANEKTCPHNSSQRIDFSGTKLRDMLVKGERPPPEMIRPEVADILLKWRDLFVE